MISAHIENRQGEHHVHLTTNYRTATIAIPPKSSGFGSSANDGELLFLALATCYCNDIYREAAKMNINVKRVQVEVVGDFNPAPGSSAENVTYSATVEAEGNEEDILRLMRHTDTVAEIQNTLRQSTAVTLASVKAVPV